MLPISSSEAERSGDGRTAFDARWFRTKFVEYSTTAVELPAAPYDYYS